ncbi:nucleotide disphospho-sugar-binding domain-containing protein [Microtetraspora sp. NBRC 13810]|uniref:nucleotide disphospho-sugar-binding domain-containing protein n=1 Tax=Microtetraspora sp. NBRC 13810 TaxID=3030990 RepID=UPI002555C1BA|nr:nucleotide disphospho-sugar-binding domain-containing protein [Microtetraspora sp. NBRC 13810]
MRILFVTWAWPSHLYAMVPVAWACRAAGHDVLVASQPELTGTILGTGLPAAPVGGDVDAAAVFREIALPPPATERRPAPGGPRVLGLLTTLAEAMTDDLVELGRNWRADLIVFEPTAFAGPLAAAALGVPAVRHLYGTDLLSAAGRFLPDALGPLCEKLGIAAVDPFGAATLDPCPPGLQVPVGSRRLPVRYVPYNGPGLLPAPPPATPPGRPLVCVTWGTTLSRLDPGLFLAGQAARAIGGLDVDVLLAVTPAQRGLLGPLPAGTRVAESAPLHLLAPGCDLVVAHGGAGTLLTALAHGLPQVLVPRLPDHVRHSARLGEAGAGVVLPAEEAAPEAIRDAVAGVLASPGHRDAAERLRREMHGQPAPAGVVPELELIAAGGTPS